MTHADIAGDSMQYEQPQRLGNSGGVGSRAKNVAYRVFAVITGAAALVGALVLSVAFFVVILAVLLIFGSYFWWKTREVRRQVREQMQQRVREPGPQGDVIEGVVISREER